MKSILRSMGAAALGFAAILLAGAAPSSAYTLNFTGTATYVSGAFDILGAAVNDPIYGSLTFNPFTTTPAAPPTPEASGFTEAGTFSFNISNPGLNLTKLGGGAGFVTNKAQGNNLLILNLGNNTALSLTLFFNGNAGGPALISLAALPDTIAGLIALVGSGSASGTITAGLGGASQVNFAITSATVASTPIPAALPLFASGLAGLGLVARQRKRKRLAA